MVHLGGYLQPRYMDLIFQLSSCVKKKFAGQPNQSDFINSSRVMGKNVYVFEKVEKPQARVEVEHCTTTSMSPGEGRGCCEIYLWI